MFRPARLVAACALALLALLTAAATPAGAQGDAGRHVVVAFWSAPIAQNYTLNGLRKGDEPHDQFLLWVATRPGVSDGLLSTVQGDYTEEQALIDVSQGTRQPSSLYTPRYPPTLRLHKGSSTISNWQRTARRAHNVSVTLKPGLLAGSVPGGAGYVGVAGHNTVAAVAAADTHGRVADVSLGPVQTVAARVAQMSASRRLVVVSVTPDAAGLAQLDQLAANRPSDELLMFAYLPPTPPRLTLSSVPSRYYKQSAFGLGRAGKVGGVTSGTTRQDGLISTIDILPTALDYLHLKVPQKVRGTDIKVVSRISEKRLVDLRRRWADVRTARQASSMRGVVALAGVVFLLLGLARGLRAAIAPSLRIGALGLMWWPTTVLLAAPFEPGTRLKETLLIAVLAISLAIVTDRLVPWPRGPAVPAAVALVLYTVDLSLGGDLMTRSVLGPSLAFGSRFYGVSNELEPLLPILLLVGLAAVLSGRPVTRRTPWIYIGSGLVLGIIVGWGRIGADVGGVITVGLAMAAATLVMLPGGITKRAVVIALLVPVAAIGALILLDLGLSGGDHLSRNLLRAENTRELWELVSRRYELAFNILTSGRTPAYFLGCAVAVAFAIRNRRWLYGTMPHRAWTAALIGGLGAGIGGMLANDSGPVLLVNSVLALATVTAYLLAGTRARVFAERSEDPGPGSPRAPGELPAETVLTG
ncbi:MAG: hypothetical protein M3155_04580 [Actinomycetota bacterium]|nr:hypothetical protein [Actinomycetota bacterium]